MRHIDGALVAIILALVFLGGAATALGAHWACTATTRVVGAELIAAPPTCTCDHAKAHAALGKRIDDLAHDVGLGDVDVACLYRGHLLLTHEGRAARAVRDQPVPGAWKPLSPLVVPPVRADCARRFGRAGAP